MVLISIAGIRALCETLAGVDFYSPLGDDLSCQPSDEDVVSFREAGVEVKSRCDTVLQCQPLGGAEMGETEAGVFGFDA